MRCTHSCLLSGADQPEFTTCQCPLTVEHILVGCTDFNDTRTKYFVTSSLEELFSTVDVRNVLDFIKETHFTAVFAVARCLFVCLSVCLSVRLSRQCIVSRWLKISSNFFVDAVAHHSGFLTLSPVPNSRGNPFSGGGAQSRSGGKILRFSTEIAVYLGNCTEQYEIGPWLQ